MTLFGWDCSRYDWDRGPMDLTIAVADGISWVVHQSTNGLRYRQDHRFPEAMRRCREAGVPVPGAYHVLWGRDVDAQVDWWVEVVTDAAPWWRPGPFMWMLDAEPFPYNGGAPPVSAINQAVDRLATRYGVRCLVYAPKWVYGDVSGIRAPIVASHYGDNLPGHYRARYPGDSSPRWAPYGQRPVILQYGDRLTVAGQDPADANAFRGTLDDLLSLIAWSPCRPVSTRGGGHPHASGHSPP